MKPDVDVALGARYRLTSRIAVGGMGEVWVAHDLSLARDVAVKVLREEFAGDAGFLERFRAEARNAAQLSHQNIAQLYDYGEQDGSAFLVMELVLGEPMSDLLDREPILPHRRLLPILAQTARALHAAHTAGVVHRDVKPGNILLSRTGRVKITDFGISTARDQVPMTASGMVMGTAQYLSPEQATGGAATPESDIYSLGIVAYEALVGHRPFTGPTAVDIAIAHVNEPLPPLPESVDPALADLVSRMLAKRPEQRPRSAAALARQLDAMLDNTPADGVPLVTGRHATLGRRRVEPTSDGLVSDRMVEEGLLETPLRPLPPSVPVARPAPQRQEPAVVPGRSIDDAVAPAPSEPPPRFTPPARSGPGDPGRQGAGATRHGTAAARDVSGPRWWTDLRRTRWAGIPGPVLLALAMLLFGLLGAMVADRIWGPSGASADHRIVIIASPEAQARDGMIPGDDSAAGQTTTAKDL
ncbi:protein kinase [Isoptericola sp. b490]|uniref:serine/threonine-protein kinase n=1 Tax=Actinotalea lenta TaxID=3064654 RepID=UPI0027128EBC|nr:serine/threonine-protein kinase [Isoptericola sp. b490]MDO8122120.1 protein kinase [Isoptericola sp. b490]